MKKASKPKKITEAIVIPWDSPTHGRRFVHRFTGDTSYEGVTPGTPRGDLFARCVADGSVPNRAALAFVQSMAEKAPIDAIAELAVWFGRLGGSIAPTGKHRPTNALDGPLALLGAVLGRLDRDASATRSTAQQSRDAAVACRTAIKDSSALL